MLPLIIPILSQVLKDPNAGRRQGVCIGLSEVMASAVKSQLLIFMDELIPTYASIRRSSSYLIVFFFKYNKLYMVDEAPNMISTLIILLSDSDSSTVEVAWEALSRVIGSVPKEVVPSYIKLGGPVVIPGFCLPKALQPLLPIFLQGLTSGSAELREQATLGLGELIEVTSEKALKDFVIPITGSSCGIAAFIREK
ncbi:hypothetical protein NC651_038462 [Populus alba x Populus x berolinensis]|nr:hypothetical protein NC651_038462 [Populus alba x Populus x berolinensis]